MFPLGFLLAACAVIPPAVPAQAAAVSIREEYSWPDLAVVRCSVGQGDLLFVSRLEQQTAGGGHNALFFGASLPGLRLGPLLARGMLRMVADPLSFSAWSGVFDERTGLVLDAALRTPRAGVLLMPVPEYCGVFCRPGSRGGTEYGAFGRLPLGPGAAAECVVLASRPDPPAEPDEWFLTRSPFPGGDLAHSAVRLVLDSPFLDFSCAAGSSSARFAAPGGFSTLWIRGRLPELEGALLLSGATPGYRAPDGGVSTVASRISGTVRLGRSSRTGSLEAGFSWSTAEPGFFPSREIPTTSVVRAVFVRDFAAASDLPVSVLLQAEKDVSRDAEGVRHETSRCGATTCLSLGRVDLTAGADVSGHDGVDVLGRMNVAPSSRFRIGVEAKGERLGAPEPTGSMLVKLVVENTGRSAALTAGIEDYPLDGRVIRPVSEFLSVRLSSSIRR